MKSRSLLNDLWRGGRVADCNRFRVGRWCASTIRGFKPHPLRSVDGPLAKLVYAVVFKTTDAQPSCEFEARTAHLIFQMGSQYR